MVTAITEGIKVSVEATYQAEYSSPHQHHFVFTYKVTIENNSNSTIQLLRRRWEVFDAGQEARVIEGDGVIGQQPIIEPGYAHQYVSGCNLHSGKGKMKGSYSMERIQDGKIIAVTIPEFQLIANIFHN
ncbi:Co2+/Mg2+ efflux protein ApaG [Echinicola strongylocentroti]|uniref:Co2+/Mg2+ efflux protein ApaG n=1 Tax=Echinicola strongylocentroti TaxID=1795355 RepID=A0A2Z4IN38_9BACT|nr:Co2+/Mg2+ efflux protein ApaG [Echinicola strongylocentroti]AWW31793.1 Co2+/Mg2+ efflux protein ApaG [Echinicola strongylocentroti]